MSRLQKSVNGNGPKKRVFETPSAIPRSSPRERGPSPRRKSFAARKPQGHCACDKRFAAPQVCRRRPWVKRSRWSEPETMQRFQRPTCLDDRGLNRACGVARDAPREGISGRENFARFTATKGNDLGPVMEPRLSDSSPVGRRCGCDRGTRSFVEKSWVRDEQSRTHPRRSGSVSRCREARDSLVQEGRIPSLVHATA